MKSKIFNSLILSILALVMLVSFVSAVSYTETFDNSTATGTYNDGSFVGVNSVTWDYKDARDEGSYSISGVGMIFRDTNGMIYSDTISGGIGNFSVKLKKASATAGDRQVELFINAVSKGTSTVFNDDTIHTFTINDINIEGNVIIKITNIKDVHVTIDDIYWTEYTASTEEFNFCAWDDGVSENPGELKVRIKDITVEKGFGDDEEWFPLDEIEVELEIENKGDDDVDDVVVEWGIYDESAEEWVIEVDDEDEFNIKDGDEEVLTFTFIVDEDDFDVDLDELEGDYVLYVRATGEVDDGTNPETCADASENIEIIIENDFVVLNNFQFPELVQCGADVQITADVWNIGDDDQDDVSVVIYNKQLGLAEEIEVGDIDAFDNEELVFDFTVPKDADEKWYTFTFEVLDEDNDIFENDYDDEEAEFQISLKVEGNCAAEGEAQALISASLESGGKAGQELVIKATIVNTGTELATYIISAARYSGWASSADLEQSTVILNAGESRDVLITLNVNKDVSGEKIFDIILTPTDGEEITQPVSVLIEKSGFDFGDVISESNWYLWLIGALNIILVIIIIVVAVRVMRK